MPRPLNILAVEPFCGGYRRRFVEMVKTHSRHRWDWRTLAARRMQRRLTMSAGWFADDLDLRPPTFDGHRHRPDVLFTSDALHLGEFLRRVPALRPAARVVFYHDHGPTALPPASEEYRFSPKPAGAENVHLLSAAAAVDEAAGRGQLWFASAYHAAAFLVWADAAYVENQSLFREDPRLKFEERARIVAMPVGEDADAAPSRDKPSRRRVIVAAETSDGAAVGAIFRRVLERGEDFDLYAIGAVAGLSGVPRVEVDPADAAAVARLFRTSRTYLAAGRDVWFDPWVIRAMRAGLWTLVPGQDREAVYEELLPAFLLPACVHDDTPGRVMGLLQNAWHGGAPEVSDGELADKLLRHDPATAVAAIDARLDRLVHS